MTSTTNKTEWTTRTLLAWMNDAFTQKQIDSPRLCAELLMSHVLGCERLKLYMDADRPAAPLERQALRDLVGRALKHEPVQYLVGEAWFFGVQLSVDKRVLIPRPSTETVIESVLHHARAEPGMGGKDGEGIMFADIGVGSGCITIALLKQLKSARAIAVDISSDAIEVAKVNAARHGVADRIEFLEGDLVAPLATHPSCRSLHYIISNPPYISDAEWAEVEPNVRDHEPHLALRGGTDGLDLVRRLVADAPAVLRPGGLLVIETASSHAKAAADIASGHDLLETVTVERDLEGHDRVVLAHRRR